MNLLTALTQKVVGSNLKPQTKRIIVKLYYFFLIVNFFHTQQLSLVDVLLCIIISILCHKKL